MDTLAFTQLKVRLINFLVCIYLATSSSVFADTKTQNFTVNATIISGCILGSGSADAASFGNINFGSSITTLSNNIDIASSSNAGSIVIKCTPGTNVTLGLDSGLNATGLITSGRLMKLSTGSSTLRYQLYQDSNRSIIWGNTTNGGLPLVVSTTGAVQQITIYARMFSTTTMPTVGQYSDTVVVTVTY